MPIHDWTRVQAGLFHDFHQGWSVEIRNVLNRGILTGGYYALVEQRVDGPEPDVIAIETTGTNPEGRTMVLDTPKTALIAKTQTDAGRYARRANRITVRHPLGNVVAMIEIVSPGNKDNRHALRAFVQKAIEFLRTGIHLLIIDIFPPSARDPQGIHRAIWDEIASDEFALPAGKSLTVVSYEADDEFTAFIEPLAVGDELPSMPLFLAPGEHVLVPLATTYATVWADCPPPIRTQLETQT